MKILHCKLTCALLIALPLLTSCGGGSSSSTVFPIDAAASAFYGSSRTFSVSNNDTADTYTITYNLTPGADMVFESVTARTLTYAATLEENGIPVEASGGTDYFQTSPYRYLGTLYNDNTYEVAANQAALPATASIGNSGAFYTSTTYTDSSKSTIEDTSVVRWSLEDDPSSRSRANFCVSNATTFVDGSDPLTTSTCLQIDESGSILGIRLSYFYADGTSVTFD
jgi:hypothetical protein